MPILIFARPERPEEKTNTYCNRISNLLSKIDQRITKQNTKLEEKRDKISNRIEKSRQKRDARLAEKREKWDANREEHFVKLEEKAGTDEQKQAILEFIETIKLAIKTRRAAINKAIQDFRKGLDEIKSSHKLSVNTAISNYRNEIKTVFEKAQSDCDNGIDPKIVREGLRNDLKQVKEDFAINKKGIEKNKDEMKSLIAAKKEAIKKAINNFEAAIEQARIDLRTSFSEELEE